MMKICLRQQFCYILVIFVKVVIQNILFASPSEDGVQNVTLSAHMIS